jgi:hypothetical protein
MWLVLGALAVSQFLAVRQNSPETVTAAVYSPQPTYTSGVLIFQSETVTAPWAGNWTPILQEGQRAAAGEILFQWQPDTLTALKNDINSQSAGLNDLLSRRASLHQSIAQGDMAALTAALLAESGTVLDTAPAADPPQVTAQVSGIFTTAADGLDDILTPDDPWAEWSLPQSKKSTTLGKLITGDRWYFRTADSLDLEPGETCSALLLGGLNLTVTLKLEEKTAAGSLFSCTQGLETVAACRFVTAKIFPNEKSGLEIPAAAVYTVNGEIGVWCLVGETARFKPVTIQQDLGDTLVVALDQTTTETLWPGDQILTEYP